MKKNVLLLIASLFFTFIPLTSHAEFTVSMYRDLKVLTTSPDVETAKRTKEMISTYLMGVASGANEISRFEKAKNGNEMPYCIPKGTLLTPRMAEDIVDRVLADRSVKLDNVDSMGISRIYVIGVLRYYKCPTLL
ncbi:hypothetical protein [Serratia ureilytica]